MKSLRRHKRVARFVKVGKGVSQVIAVLLMIAIAVIAALVAYFWVMGYFKTKSTTVSKAIQVQNVYYTGPDQGDWLYLYVQNVGKGSATLIADQCLYVGGVLQKSGQILDPLKKTGYTTWTLQETNTAQIADQVALTLGQTYKLKVVTSEGTFVEYYFTVNSFTGQSPYALAVIVDPAAGGNVTRDKNPPYNYGDVVTLTESQNLGYTFSSWSGDGIGTGTSRIVTVTGIMSVTAYFTPNSYKIDVTVNGQGHVDRNATEPYAYGQAVNLTAVADPGWIFSTWGGDLTGVTSNPATMVMTTNSTVTATFTPNTVSIAFRTSGMAADAGSATVVTIDSTPYIYSDLQTLSFNWIPGSTHSITASTPVSAGTGKQYVWTSWSATSFGSSTTETYTYTVPSTGETVTTNYNTQYQILVDTLPVGAEGGTFNVTYTQNGVVYASTNSTPWQEWVDNNTQVTVSNPESPIVVSGSAQYVFNSYNPSDTLTVTQASEIVLNYGAQYSVSFTQAGSGAAPNVSYQINGGSTQMGSVPFSVWAYQGDLISYSYPAVVSGAAGVQYTLTGVTPASPQVIVDQLTIAGSYNTQYYLTVTSPNDNPTGQGWYDSGSTASSSVTSPVSGGTGIQYVATGYTGTGSAPASGSGTSVSFSMTSPTSITWAWKTQYLLTIQTSGLSSSSYSTNVYLDGGQAGTAYDGSSFTRWFDASSSTGTIGVDGTVSGAAGTQYAFVQWSEDLSTSNPRASVTMNAPATFTANYKTQYQVSFVISPSGSGLTSPSGTNVWYDAGYTINPLTATANTGFAFSSWSTTGSIGIANPSSASTSATISSPGAITATFITTLDHFTITGYPTTVTAGQVFSGVTVTAYDASNHVMTGYTGQVYFISSDAQAILPYSSSSKYTFVGTDNGVHMFSGFTLKTAGSQTVTVTDGTISAISNPITVNAGAFAGFTITGYPSSVLVGQSFDSVTVKAVDAYGNVVTGYRGRVYFTSTDPEADLPYHYYRYTFTSGDSGVHVFSGFVLYTTGSQTITVTDGTISATSNAITVSVPIEPHYHTSITPTSTSASATISYTYTITRDYSSNHNLGWATIQVPAAFTGITVTTITVSNPPGGTWVSSVSGNTITVHAQSSSSELQSSNQYVNVVFSATAPSSLGTYGPFASTVYEHYDKSGSGPGTNNGPDPSVTVHGPFDHFTITGYPSSVAAGQDFGYGNEVVVTACDAYGNVVGDYTGSVYFTSTDVLAVLPYTSGNAYTFTSGDAGVHTFDDEGFILKTVGPQTITVTDGTKSATSNTITVNPGSLDHFTVTAPGGGNIGTQTVGTAFSITITAKDLYGNTVTSYTGTPTLSCSAGVGTINPTNIGALSGGTKTGSVTLTKTGTGLTITATDGSTTGTSKPFNVNPGSLDHFTVTAPGGGNIGSQTRGVAFSILVTAYDVNNNVKTDYAGPATLSDLSTSITPTSTGAFTNGAVTISVTVANSYTNDRITATDGGKTGQSNSFNVRVNPAVSAPTFSPSSPITLGGSVTASVTVSGSGATPTGTVDFQVSTDGITFNKFGATKALSGSGSATSDSYTPTATGTYYIRAVYSGDSNYNSATGSSTSLTVNKANPTVLAPTLTPSSPITLGGSVTASVTVSGSGATPTGTVDFQVSTDGITFNKFGATKALSGSGSATSDSYTPTATGTYYIRAVYSGDSNYNSATGSSTSLTVNKAALALDGSSGNHASGTSVSTSLTTSKSPDVIYVVVGVDTGTISTPTATGLTFTKRAESDQTSARVATFYAIASSTLSSRSITATATGSNTIEINVFGISGANTVTPFDSNTAIPATSKGSGTAASVTVSTSNANDIIIGAICNARGSDASQGSGFTLIQSSGTWSGTALDTASEYKAVTATQTGVAVPMTVNAGGGNWAMIGDAIVQAP